MSKHLRIWLSVLLSTLLTSTTLPAEGVITTTTSKAVGETIELRIEANGNVTIEGAQYTGETGHLNLKSYRLTNQTIFIRGDVTEFDCSINELISLDVSKNTALTELACIDNQLTRLDVSKNTALTMLDCFSNQLISLNVSKNTALEVLDCSYNQLTSLDVLQNTALTDFDCSNNQLTSLNVSKNRASTDPKCNNNQLKSLDLPKNPALTTLYCSYNQLTSLNVSKNPALIELARLANQLISLNVSKNTALIAFYCYENQLTNLNVSGCISLRDLDCSSNYINGKAMTKLVNSLPNRRRKSSGRISLVDRSSKKRDKNRCSAADVTIVRRKNWEVAPQERSDWDCKFRLVRPTRGRLSTTFAYPSVVRGRSPSDRRLRYVGPLRGPFLPE